MPSVSRTRVTWLMYATNGVSAFFVYSVGPATPLIADDLGISRQASALHGTAMAVAMLAAGPAGARMIRALGRSGTIVACMGLLAAGVLGVVLAPILAVSLVGTAVAGVGGGIAAIAANATLADLHSDVAPAVLTEANATAGWVGLLAPLAMGGLLSVGLGWRPGLALAVLLAGALALLVRRGGLDVGSPGSEGSEPVGGLVGAELATGNEGPELAVSATGARLAEHSRTASERSARRRVPVPRLLWVVMAAVSAAAGAEFAVNYWGSALLELNTGESAGTVTAAMSAPVAGIAVGRTIGARLALRLPAHALLVGGWLVALAGFAIFWRAGELPLAVVGLFVTGLGLSVIYPLLLDRAVLHLPADPDRAIALAAPFIGGAIGLAPFLLGALAGGVGVVSAFLVVPVILAVGLLTVLGSRPPAGGDGVSPRRAPAGPPDAGVA